MIKVFCSGSCRLLTSMNNGYDKVIPIHSMFKNYIGINFLGKLHNTKQHIQFMRFIKNEIEIPEYILPLFLTSYTNYPECEDTNLIPIKIENIKRDFDNCDWYIFEICSLKLYSKDGFQVQREHTHDYEIKIQSYNELLEDLQEIRNMIPEDKKILFQVHFRPNIINNDENRVIENRETIYNAVKDFCDMTENCFLYDPSIILANNKDLYDGGNHFFENGHSECFNHMYETYFSSPDI